MFTMFQNSLIVYIYVSINIRLKQLSSISVIYALLLDSNHKLFCTDLVLSVAYLRDLVHIFILFYIYLFNLRISLFNLFFGVFNDCLALPFHNS